MSASSIDQGGPTAGEFASVEELARRQGVAPIASADELARPGIWESDEELDAFISDLHASRSAGSSL
jgi:hypothetical protein